MKCRKLLALLCVLALLPVVAPVGRAGEPPYFAITNVRIVSVSGAVVDGGTVVIAKGLIAAVGKNAAIPPEALVIDGKGLTVYPGLIDSLSDVGLQAGAAPAPAGGPGGGPPGGGQQQQQQAGQLRSEGPQDRPGTTPWETAADNLRTADRRIETWRNAGFTTTLASPARGVFPGQGSVINLAGERPENMVVQSPAALRVNFSGAGGGYTGFPGALMGVIAYIKQVFSDTSHYAAAQRAYSTNPRGGERPTYDRTVRVMDEAVRSGRPILIPGNDPPQIARAMSLANEFSLKAVIYGGQEGYRAAESLRGKNIPVLVSLRFPERPRDADPEAEQILRVLRLRDRAASTPAALQKAGVKFAFYSDGIANPRDMIRNVKKTVDAGLPAADAIRALTLSAAEIYGVADRLGSIETGKIANLLVTEGDIFDERMRIKMVFVDGQKFDVKEEAPPPPQQGQQGGQRANLAGRWSLVVDTPDGPQPATMDVTVAGDGSLSGTLGTQFGPTNITKGSVTGNRFTLSFTLDFGQGPTEFTMNGTVEGNSMSGTVGFADQTLDFTGTRSGPGAQEWAEGGAR